MAKQDEWTRITLRLPTDLHGRLVKAAETRSLNAVIVEALQEKFPPPVNMDEVWRRFDALAKENLDPAHQAEFDELFKAILDSVEFSRRKSDK